VDVVAVKLLRQGEEWRVAEINPASVELPLTGTRARTILGTLQLLSEGDRLPAEAWVLPFTFYGGLLRLPLQARGMVDEVERLLLPGLQERHFGLLSLLRGRQLWRDFKAAVAMAPAVAVEQPAAWAAAVEFVLSEQEEWEVTQAAAGRFYKASLGAVAGRIKQIKKALQIQRVDQRYRDRDQWIVERDDD
jgi:hypothetical protein